MSTQIPKTVDPWLLCSQDRIFEGEVDLVDLPRLLPLVRDPEGTARYSLLFTKNREKKAVLRGEITTQLMVDCQRCLGPLTIEVDSQFEIVFISRVEQGNEFADEVVSLLVHDSEMTVMDAVEDELILAIPDAPMHAESDCAVSLTDVNQAPEGFEIESPKKNPFAVLASLKNSTEN